MRTLVLSAVLLAFTMGAAAEDAIVLKATKTKFVGVVTNVTEKSVSIVTAGGLRTYAWDVVDEATIKRYNPALYKQIADKNRKAFEEQRRKLGLVEYKGAWMKPAQKEAAQMRDKGLALYDGKWLPTNEVATLEFRKKMEAEGKKEYKGAWYTEQDLKVIQEAERNKGLTVGMTTNDVVAAWGEPALIKESKEFTARKRECWFYPRKDEGKEDRVVFEMGTVKDISTDQEISQEFIE